MSTACRIGFGVGPAVPESVKTLKDYLAWAKANPGQGNYGSPGAGSPPHFIGALLGKEAGLDPCHVPYRGSAPGIQDLLGSQVPAMTSPIGDHLPHLASGKLRLLATSGSTRSRFAPTVPTYAEQGFPNLVMNEYYEFFMPGKTGPSASLQARRSGTFSFRYAANWSNVPPQPCRMASCEAANVRRSSGVASCGDQRTVIAVRWSPAASNTVSESVCNGHVGLSGWRLTPPAASENEVTTTSRSGGAISRNTHLPHMSWPSAVRMP